MLFLTSCVWVVYLVGAISDKITEMDAEEQQYFTKYLSPANPIITKKIEVDETIKMKVNPTNNPPSLQQRNRMQQLPFQEEEEEEEVGRLTLLNAYPRSSLVYRKWDNSRMRKRSKNEYFASVFTNLSEWPEQPFSTEVEGMRFHSDRESMNLFAVYKVGPTEFDLILQNDINTSGYTQWFYFAVTNRHRNRKIKVNIVNLYKTRSLYSQGMKPVVMSKKSNRGWIRAGTSIYYTQNEINVEHSRRFYHTLSFEHTFLADDDETMFAHSFPYTSVELKNRFKSFENNRKIQVRSLGQTCLKKGIPIVEISQQNSNPNKKAMVIMARQHPGETVGSYIMDQILAEMNRASTETQFLLWRFNVYCIPIVNVDGVELGNYRGNAQGFDLNRSWDRENINRLPEISHIKKQIKRIQKKYPIELILDLHGHSRKMGSFFYGNPYGKNTGLFAYVAAKMSPCVSFGDSTFHKEKAEKVTTARVVLGNIIKDTGCFYTYETSFFGSNLNGKKQHHTIESLRDLGKNLVAAASKTFLQIQKEEKSLRESIFLKEVRKQLAKMTDGVEGGSSSGSDSDAAELTMKELEIKNEQMEKEGIEKTKRDIKEFKIAELKKHNSVEVQVGTDDLLMEDRDEEMQMLVQNAERMSPLRRRRDNFKTGSASQKYSLHVGFQRSQEDLKLTESQPAVDPLNRKHFLMQKLRIFGQTFIEPNPKDKNKETQTGNDPLNILGKGGFVSLSREESPMKVSQYRKKRNRNKSLIIRVDNREKIAMSDIVKVNKLEYRKIRRESVQDMLSKPRSKYQLLPIIN